MSEKMNVLFIISDQHRADQYEGSKSSIKTSIDDLKNQVGDDV